MFTRFRTPSSEYLMQLSDGVPPNTPGEAFLDLLASSYQENIKVSRAELLKSARALQKFAAENRHLLAYRYNGSYRTQDRGNRETVRQWARTAGIMGVGDIKIDGRVYILWAGDGQCYLERKTRLRAGAGREMEQIDLRERKTIQTDNFGIVKITKKRREFRLPEALAKCIAFLESVPDRKITLYSYDQPPTVGDLVDDFGEADDRNEWVLEEIARDARHWKSELLAALNERAFQYHRETIVRLLLLSFQDPKTRTSLIKTIKALPQKHQTDLLALVEELGTPKKRS